MRSFGGAICVLLGVACVTAAPSSDGSPWPAPVAGRDLGGLVGARVSVVGREAREIWQHLVGGVAGKEAVYFDLADGDQIVVHVARRLTCTGLVELAGTVREERGGSKRPGAAGETKVDETYVEYALDVDTWRCRAAMR